MEINWLFVRRYVLQPSAWFAWAKVGWLAWVLLIGAGSASWAQPRHWFIYELLPLDAESGDIVYRDVVPVAQTTKLELYNRAHAFLTQTMRSGSLIPMARPSKWHINQCGIITLAEWTTRGNRHRDYRLSIVLKVKAGRYRYELSQFRAHPDSLEGGLPIRQLYPYTKGMYAYEETQAQQLRAWDRSVKAYLKELHQYMLGQDESRATKLLYPN